jgi:triosephosphate isomerase
MVLSNLLVINFKNYVEIAGIKSLELAKKAEKIADKVGFEVIVCPPHPMLSLVAREVRIDVFSQSVDKEKPGQSTGYIVPEIVRSSGASGTLLNHSEHRIGGKNLLETAERAREAGLKICLCLAKIHKNIKIDVLRPDYIAIEPPELIGTGISVSKAKPDTVRKGVDTLRAIGYRGKILCGAGITTSEDVKKALKLGSEGVLVSSSIVRSKNWEVKIEELGSELV